MEYGVCVTTALPLLLPTFNVAQIHKLLYSLKTIAQAEVVGCHGWNLSWDPLGLFVAHGNSRRSSRRLPSGSKGDAQGHDLCPIHHSIPSTNLAWVLQF
jgi:hypothetical protein